MNRDYVAFAKALAEEAGTLLLSDFYTGVNKSWKADNTPVTETDIKINHIVIDKVTQAFPGHSVLAEEGDYHSTLGEFVWVCDPLDGTIPFAHGVPTSVFSIALLEKGEAILGVVYDPFMKRMYVGEKGKGAFLNQKRISVSEHTELKGSVIGLIQWSDAHVDLSRTEHFLQLAGAKVLNTGSIAAMGALVSDGKFAATIFAGDKPHDSAALKVLVEEAGGRVTDVYGQEQRYDAEIKGHISSNTILHDKLVAIVQDSMK